MFMPGLRQMMKMMMSLFYEYALLTNEAFECLGLNVWLPPIMLVALQWV
jgi:hypothetical protein